MNKKWILIFVFAIMLILPQNVLADDPEYNGTGSGATQEGGGILNLSQYWQSASNSETYTIKVTLVYYDQGTEEMTRNPHNTHPFYITNNLSKVKSLINDTNLPIYDANNTIMSFSTMSSGKTRDTCGIVNCTLNIGKLRKFFENSDNYTNGFKIVDKLGLDVTKLDGEFTEQWGTYSGYRLLLEPCFIGARLSDSGTQENKLLSIRAWAGRFKQGWLNGFGDWSSKANYMYIEVADMFFNKNGPIPGNLSDNVVIQLLAEQGPPRNGIGMNLVKFSPIYICYKDNIESIGDSLKCKANGTHTNTAYTQTISSSVCSSGEKPEDSGFNKFGKIIKKFGNKKGKRCIIACQETVNVSLPGSLQGAIDVSKGDSYFEWPTIFSNTLYTATISGKRDCTVTVESGITDENKTKCFNYLKNTAKDNTKGLYSDKDFDNKLKLSYNDPTYKLQNVELKQTYSPINVIYSKDPKKKDMNGLKITVTRNTSLSLPDKGVYKYVNKLTGKFGVMPFLSSSFNTLQNSVLAVAKSSLKPDNYDMKLTGKIGGFQQSIGDYKCHYKLTESTDTDCGQCPPGTLNEGTPLNKPCAVDPDKLMSEKTSYASVCTALKETICNLDKTQWENHGYDESRVCCEAPYASTDITDCIKNGKSKEECSIQAGCINGGSTPPPDPIVCPPGTEKCGLDITECVKNNMKLGMTENEAKNRCITNTCNGPQSGGIIIYRTINLNNPFPSKLGNAGNSSVFWSNGINVGRRPGNNWNNKRLVENKILNNRGVKGEAVYTKTPLYTITLDATKIRKIREYNKTHKYSDFTLRCATKGGGKCISDFLRSPSSGNALTGGTCRRSNDFDACYNRG